MLVAAGLLASSCSATGSNDQVLVFAASSLTDSFAEIERAFEAKHPDVDIVLNLAGSATLREQIIQGAPGDVLASANRQTMAQVVEAVGTRTAPQTFATNSLTIVVPAGNPGGVRGIDSFARSGLVLGICAPSVPCGDAALSVFEQASVDFDVDTEEPNVRSLLSKVVADELDGGLVYSTDAKLAAPSVEIIDLPAGIDVETAYQVAALESDDARSPVVDQFVQFVVGPEAQAILSTHGFGTK